MITVSPVTGRWPHYVLIPGHNWTAKWTIEEAKVKKVWMTFLLSKYVKAKYSPPPKSRSQFSRQTPNEEEQTGRNEWCVCVRWELRHNTHHLKCQAVLAHAVMEVLYLKITLNYTSTDFHTMIIITCFHYHRSSALPWGRKTTKLVSKTRLPQSLFSFYIDWLSTQTAMASAKVYRLIEG